MDRPRVTRCLVLIVCVTVCSTVNVGSQPQGGDQFLDGIGETALLARHVLNGGVTLTLEEVLDQGAPSTNRLYSGKAQ